MLIIARQFGHDMPLRDPESAGEQREVEPDNRVRIVQQEREPTLRVAADPRSIGVRGGLIISASLPYLGHGEHATLSVV